MGGGQPFLPGVRSAVVVYEQRLMLSDRFGPNAGIDNVPFQGIAGYVALLHDVFRNRVKGVEGFICVREFQETDLAVRQRDCLFEPKARDLSEGSCVHPAQLEERV